jgi:hypothetical protein
MSPRSGVALLASSFLALTAAAQDEASATKTKSPLERACDKMQSLGGVAFSTIESQDNALTRQIRGQLPGAMGDTEVAGKWSGNVLQASLNVDQDEVVIHGGRMIARTVGGPWRLRQNALANGGQLPFVFDPQRFFSFLGGLPASERKVVHEEKTTYRQQELTVYTITLEGDAAVDCNFNGAAPSVSGGGRMMMIGLPGMGDDNPPELTVDVAIWVDPTTDLVHRIKVKSYQENAMPAGIQVRIGGPDGAEEVEPPVEDPAADAGGAPAFKQGLPVRKVGGNTSAMEFEVRFTDHGKTQAPPLDEGARRMIGVGTAK